jgi:hypothetical protein
MRVTVTGLMYPTVYIYVCARIYIYVNIDRLCDLVVNSSWLQIRRPGFDSRHYQEQSSGSGTGSTQPREYDWGATWLKSSGSCLENQEYGRRNPSRWPRGPLYLQKVGNHFADNRRSLGRYSLLADSDHGVFLYVNIIKSWYVVHLNS